MNDILPEDIQWRHDKTILDPFYEKNLLLFEKNILEDIIFSKNQIIERYVDIKKTKEIYKKYNDGKADSDSIYWLWLVSILALWLNKNNTD